MWVLLLCALASAQLCDQQCSLVLGLTNQARQQNGLPPLCINADLMQAAQVQASYQQQTGIMSHTGSGGSNVGDRVTAAGYTWSSCAENVAMGQTTAKTVMLAWLNSPDHRENIMSKNTEMGIARSGNFWAQTFGKPRGGNGGCNVGVPGGSTGTLPQQIPDSGPTCDSFCLQLLQIVNQKRATQGKQPVCINPKLMTAASTLAQQRSLNNLENAVDNTGFGTKGVGASEDTIFLSRGSPTDSQILQLFQSSYASSGKDSDFNLAGIAGNAARDYWVVIAAQTYSPDQDRCNVGGSLAPAITSPPAASPFAYVPGKVPKSSAQCSQYTTPCECTGACGWSTSRAACLAASASTFTDCQECSSQAHCTSCNKWTTACQCVGKAGCGWSTGAKQCMQGHQTDCTECPSQSGCPSTRKKF